MSDHAVKRMLNSATHKICELHGAQRANASPAAPSSILQIQSGSEIEKAWTVAFL